MDAPTDTLGRWTPSGRPVAPIPRMAATIAQRILVNYRVDPDIARSLLPDGIRPQIVDDSAVAGVCLIHLTAFRPAWFAPAIGHRSRNAAHRIAVEWDTAEGPQTGVYIPRRHSSSILARLVGGRVFPGTHAPASVDFRTSTDALEVRVEADDLRVRVDARRGAGIPFRSSLFETLEESSTFFRKDAVGWSPTRSGALEGLRLATDAWRVEPIDVTALSSTFFDTLPRGAAEFDHALLMHDVPTQWSSVSPPATIS
ncbi:DUF2071 domain-containing protein [Microbacterium sp. KSW2-21]|uniref:DUF2071 domain-containing protein n=1 Tax=Microbacterium algihabitans TaxID=3075992 RepID=A0ABU3RRT1_9MICO|nr:DUF2071 domain-containing protein [Microbacterium sp. KSW2-21]MDU0325612.1 DUF2071 domain-containing protein [Microbacterium sp. KSW2-21]